jgi:hypothetical protein
VSPPQTHGRGQRRASAARDADIDTVWNSQWARHMDARSWLLIASLATLPACATVAVAPGHAAVVLDASGALTRLDEGVADVSFAAQVDDFDLRQQTQGGTFTALSADGVPLVVRDPIISYTLVADELVALDRDLGRDGWRPLVAAVVQSAVAGVLGGYRWDELDSARLRQAQARIIALAAARLRPHHLALDSVELKGVTARLPALARAVTATSIWEQRSAQAQTQVELGRQRADNLRAEAAGIAAANRSVAPTLDAAVLADKSNQAWARLVASPSTTVHVSNDRSTLLEVSP